MQIQISWLLRSQLIWIYTVCKGRVYPGSAGQGLTKYTTFALSIGTDRWMFNILHKFSAEDFFLYIFLFSPENMIWHFMQQSPMEAVCAGENKKNVVSLLSAELPERVVKAKQTALLYIWSTDAEKTVWSLYTFCHYSSSLVVFFGILSGSALFATHSAVFRHINRY